MRSAKGCPPKIHLEAPVIETITCISVTLHHYDRKCMTYKSSFVHIHLRFSVIHPKYFKRNFLALYNDLIICFRKNEDYHDLLENRIIRFWLNNTSIRRYALSL